MTRLIKKIYSKLFLVAVVFMVWLLLSFSFDLPHIVVGLIVSFIVVWLFSDVCLQKQWKFSRPFRYLWFLYYIPIFSWEVIKANLDVAYRILHPTIPIKPGIVKVKTKLKSDTGITFLANSITLTPGTLSVDVDQENGFIYVYWIYVRSQDIEDTTKRIVSKFESILEKIFD